MQYKTMIFDANRPVVQSITEPLNSEYGIAVKVKKDGEFLPYEQVKVDGKGSNANRDGWACFELETDNEIGVETISIEATVGAADTVYTHTFTGTAENVGGEFYVQHTLSDISELPETVNIKDVTGIATATGDGFSGTASIPTPWPAEVVAQMFPQLSNYTVYDLNVVSQSIGYGYVLIDDNGTTKWARAPYELGPGLQDFTIVSTATVSAKDAMLIAGCHFDKLPKTVSYSANVELTVSGGEGGSSVIKFPLMVNKRDMGYIEPAENKIQ